MSTDFMNYTAMVEDALRGVVRSALARAAEQGLPGNHHFYVSFLTRAPGVDIPYYLRERYSEEMTIVLQHQFWGMEAGETGFAVTLSFNKVQERLSIPYSAITAFADPSVQFGLQFRGRSDAPAVESATAPAPQPEAEETAADGEKKGGEVVTLDAFRKK